MEILELIQQPTYIKIRVIKTDVKKLADWMQETECGKQVSMNCFAFKTEAEYAMFLLRWSPTGKLRDMRTHKGESSL